MLHKCDIALYMRYPDNLKKKDMKSKFYQPRLFSLKEFKRRFMW